MNGMIKKIIFETSKYRVELANNPDKLMTDLQPTVYTAINKEHDVVELVNTMIVAVIDFTLNSTKILEQLDKSNPPSGGSILAVPNHMLDS